MAVLVQMSVSPATRVDAAALEDAMERVMVDQGGPPQDRWSTWLDPTRTAS